MADSKDVQHMTKLGLESNIETASEDKLFYYHRGVKDVAGDVPVIVLIHGYPQSSVTRHYHFWCKNTLTENRSFM